MGGLLNAIEPARNGDFGLPPDADAILRVLNSLRSPQYGFLFEAAGTKMSGRITELHKNKDGVIEVMISATPWPKGPYNVIY